MTKEELLGSWGVDTGYENNPDEVRIEFYADGTGAINPHADKIEINWHYGAGEGLSLKFEDRWRGPFTIYIQERDLPQGRFLTLHFVTPILPFGLKTFQKRKEVRKI